MNALKLVIVILTIGGIGTYWYGRHHLRHTVKMPARHSN